MQSGDNHFQKQRWTADNADMKTAKRCFYVMQRIGEEMQEATEVMDLVDNAKILDLCMAPGGYSAAALKSSPQASVSGATLPVKLGGHELWVKDGYKGASIRVWKGDLTLLVGDMGIEDGSISERHPNFGKFRKDEIWSGEKFDLVFCDGQVLRNHAQDMIESRQQREARRLLCSQLLIALRHVKSGGSTVVLLHNIDRWDTLLTIRTFDRFANITLFKPKAAHKSRGSFYLVAKDIHPDHPDALMGIQNWTKSWKDATFPNLADDDSSSDNKDNKDDDLMSIEQVAELMDEFGERLITLAEKPWKIQKKAIENSAWFKRSKTERGLGKSNRDSTTGVPSKIKGSPANDGQEGQ